MRNKVTRRLLALILAVVLLGGFATAFAGEKPLPESGTFTPSQFSAQKDAGGASDTRQGRIAESASELIEAVAFELPEGLVADEAISLSRRLTSEGSYTSEEGYTIGVATMLTLPAGIVGFDGAGDGDVVEAMVWLQELPAVLARIYNDGNLFTPNYSGAATAAATARAQIRTMGGIGTALSRTAPAINIHFEYSEIFAGFAINAPLSELQKIADMAGVFAVTEMAYYELDNEYIPDPDYITPGNLESREYARIGELHAEGIDGKGVKVGVIDSGIQASHPEFKNNYKGGYNFLVQSSNMNNPDGSHGTHVSGIIASAGILSLGVAPAVDFYMAQVFGTPENLSGSDAVVTAAMEAFGSGTGASGLPKVDVVNMSLGIRSPNYNSAYVSGSFARNNMVIAGVTVVNSAGNSAVYDDETQLSGTRRNYSTTSSNASLPIAVASAQFGSSAGWVYSDAGYSMTVANGDSKLSGVFLGDDFGNKNTISITLTASNAGSYLADLALGGMPLNYYGTYTRTPLVFVEGKGYEIVWINLGADNPLADTTEALAIAWRAANAADSMAGKILAFNRGIGFGVMYGEALRTGAAGVIMLDRDAASTVNMTIGNVPSTHGVVFQTGVGNRAALLALAEDGKIFFNPKTEGRSSESAPKLPSDFSSIGPVKENAHIKPDVTAPGDAILSTGLNSGYEQMGGTSMSSPFVAGCAALLIQHLRATGQDASPAVVKARLMNTADPYLIKPLTGVTGHPAYYFDPAGTESSVYEQGSGFVNPYRAIKENVYITVDMQVPTGSSNQSEMAAKMASFSFGEVEKGKNASLTATVNGLAEYDVAVTYNKDTCYSNKNLNDAVTVAVAKSGNSFTATVSVGENANADKKSGGNLYEGYILVTGGGKEYVLPWAVRVPNEYVELAEGWAKVTLSVPTDVWDDGSGYQMWLDKDLTLRYAYLLSDILDAADYRLPTNATLNGFGTDPVVYLGSETVTIPASYYDFLTLNPVPGDGYYEPGGDYSSAEAFAFEANKHYTFTAVWQNNDVGDGFVLTVVDEEIEPPAPEPGTSSQAKVTLVNPADFPIANVRVAMLLNESNELYDMFFGPWGGNSVNFAWLQANCYAIPSNAIIGNTAGSHMSFLGRGETASAVLSPDKIDLISMWKQNDTGFGVFAEDLRCVKEFDFKAGWEYIFTARFTGSNVAWDLEKVPYNKELDFDGDSWITLNVPTDVWGDGSGYVLFLDSDAKMTSDLIAAGGLSGNWPTGWPAAIDGYADIRIPANATANASSPSVLPGNSVTIAIKSGIYDFLTINPDGYGFYVPSGGTRYGDDFAFEAGMHYTFTAVEMGFNDGILLTVAPIPPAIVLEEATVAIAAPVARVVPQTSVSGTGFTGAITWTPADAKFGWSTVYTANVALSAIPGFFFSDTMTVTVPGATSVSVTVVDEKNATASAVFPATAANPGMANIIVVDGTGNEYLNLLLLDSTQQAIAKRLSGASLSVFTDFDDTVPAVAQWGSLTTDDLFQDEAEGEIIAGTYDTFWAFWTDTAGWKTAFATKFTFEANKTYLVVVSDHGEGWDLGTGAYTIAELTDETRFDSFTVNKNFMNMLGGQWKATAKGIFHEDVKYDVYLDGALIETGTMAGSIAVKTATIAIPKNETGIDRLYEIKLPAFGVSEKLVVSGAELGLAQVTYTVGDPWNDGSGYMLLLDSTNTAAAPNFALYDYHLPSDAATGHDMWNESETIDVIEGTYAYMESNWWMGSFFSPIYAKNFEIQAGYHYFFERWTYGASYLLISWLTCCENPDNEPIRSDELSILPTCTEDGLDVYVCKFCGTVCYDEVVEALGHDYIVKEVVPPTCTEEGYTTYICTRCEDEYNDDFEPALGHDYQYSFGVNNDKVPYAKCSRCGDKVYVVKIELNAFVDKKPGNKNDLTITVTETYEDGYVSVLTETFVIDNNAIGTYTIEYYKIYVDTKGNVQIRELYIANGVRAL